MFDFIWMLTLFVLHILVICVILVNLKITFSLNCSDFIGGDPNALESNFNFILIPLLCNKIEFDQSFLPNTPSNFSTSAQIAFKFGTSLFIVIPTVPELMTRGRG